MALSLHLCQCLIDNAVWKKFRNPGPENIARVIGVHDYDFVFPEMSIYGLVYDEISHQIPNFHSYKTQSKMRLTRYLPGHFISRHQDSLDPNRALTITIQLSDPNSYEGGETVFDDGTILSKEHGFVNLSSPWDWHCVKPLISGVRYSLVWWLCQPD